MSLYQFIMDYMFDDTYVVIQDADAEWNNGVIFEGAVGDITSGEFDSDVMTIDHIDILDGELNIFVHI